jgi:energy-coupling factor transporter ATP-binding protein EcfA2
VNWHNFVDETIDVANGGHLFLLGDNGSGKTTVLDAIHYVLTGGENLEFNAAARVAGNRLDGRRPQGIIMRHNVETGPLNPSGGVTYAALEILNARGVPSTFAVGLEVHAMNERLQRWGIIRECPLEEVPLRIERDGEHYPAGRQDIRQHFGSRSGYYSGIDAYLRELASRLFRDESAFAEICRLLKMGKAYREIAAHSGDYHELFKRLLPEPQPDIFERIVDALNTLDSSVADLERLQEQLDYLNSLAAFVTQTEEAREREIRLHWIEGRLQRVQHRVEIQKTEEAIMVREQRLAELAKALAAYEREREAAQKLVADLQTKDSSGLVRQEKELTTDLERLQILCAQNREAAKQAARSRGTAEKAAGKQRDSLTARLRKLLADVNRLYPKLPVSLAEFAGELDAALRHERPAELLDNLPFADVVHVLRDRETGTATELGQVAEQLKQAGKGIAGLEQELAELRKQTELLPDIRGYREGLRALSDGMFLAMPLYKGLEWRPGMTDARRSAMEELIGQDVLATFVVEDDGERHEEAAQALFAVAPGLRIAEIPDGVNVPPWIRDCFDLARSHPAAIGCLAAEMITRLGPATEAWDGHQILRFRGHRRRLAGKPAAFIGSADREATRKRRIASLEAKLSDARSVLHTIEAEKKRLDTLLQSFHETARVVEQGQRELGMLDYALRTAEAEWQAAERKAEETKHQAEASESESRAKLERREQLREQIAAEGLADLEKRLEKARRREKRANKCMAETHEAVGENNNQLKGLLQRKQKLEADIEEVGKQIESWAEKLLVRKPEIEDVAEYILVDCSGSLVHSAEEARAKLAETHDCQTSLAEKIALGIRDERHAATFNFTYDREGNRLLDRRNRGIADVVADLDRRVNEQRELINERTRELFRKLVMGELLGHLRAKVDTLDQMVREINQQLSKRSFGTNQYSFQLRPVERFSRLVELVRTHNLWSTEADEDELRRFFEDQRDAITSTEAGSVPELLDYRNWFHYDMRLQSTDGNGVVIDRHTKSIGSGGEQAVPNYLLILTVAHFMLDGNQVPLHVLLFDEAFYGIDAGRRDQLLGFASDLGIQLFVASPDQDGVRQEVPDSTTILVVKDDAHDVHLYPFNWENPRFHHRDLFAAAEDDGKMAFEDEI